ncbi:MAG: hypothetical protein K0R16_1808 [Nitrososphaeraceae archaeon]|jgi:hypothetical protein|nr:hypothetical protein [Nitrososphaeraceae archaeon]MDF2768266.1 hypothetical protein [Nitrososphaeraceae archaeon]
MFIYLLELKEIHFILEKFPSKLIGKRLLWKTYTLSTDMAVPGINRYAYVGY